MNYDEIQRKLAELNSHVNRLHQQRRFMEAIQFAQQSCSISKLFGDDHPSYATSINDLATLYLAIGDYGKAEPLYQQALEIKKKTLGEDHPSYATGVNNLASLYTDIGAYEKAEPLYQKALLITKKALGENHRDYAGSLNNLAMFYLDMGAYEKAEPLFQQALIVYKNALGEEHPDYATCLNNLGLLYQKMGAYREAEPLFQKVLQMRKKAFGEEHPVYANSLNNLAGLYQLIGAYEKAEPLFLQALNVYKNTLGEEHPIYANSLNNLAGLYQLMGVYEKAEPLYQQTLLIWKMKVGEEHPLYATTLNNLAGLFKEIGAYEKAELLFQQVVLIRKKSLGEDHPDYARSLNNLAVLYDFTGTFEKAEPLFQQALQIWKKKVGEENPDYANTLNNLAGLYQYMRTYEKAEPLFQQALQICKTALGEDHPSYANTLNNLANLYQAMGTYEKAEPLYQQALLVTKQALGENHPNYAHILNNLARLYAAANRVNEALDLLKNALNVDDRMIGQVFSIGSEKQRLSYLASIRSNVDIFISLVYRHFPQSPSAIQDTLHLILKRKAITAEALAAQRDAVISGKYPQLKDGLQNLTTLRMQIAQKTLAGPGKEGWEKHHQMLAAWNAEKEHLEQDLARQVPEIKLEQQFRTADNTVIAHTLPPGSSLVEFFRFHEFDFTAVPAKGQKSWKPSRYCAFVLPGGEPDHVTMVDLGEADQIDQLIAIYKSKLTEKGRAAVQSCPEKKPGMLTRLFGKKPEEAALSSRRDIGVVPEPVLDKLEKESGLLLYSALIAPICDVIGNRGHLILAPDSQLSTIPFEVIPTPDGGYLIDLYHISYVGVGRDVLRFTTRFFGKPEKAMVMASPAYDLHIGLNSKEKAQIPFLERKSRDLSRGAYHFTPLPGTKIEGKKIATLLGVSPLLDEDALEARLKSVSSPFFIHIATHGFFLKDQEMSEGKLGRDFDLLQDPGMQRFSGRGMENPMLRSGLALAGANTWMKNGELPPEAEDGILTAEDVSGLDLSYTSLAVLSACETGLGDVKTGEGVFGLRRAFTLSGANTLLMSLWKVPDLATQELMVDFYKRVLAGTPKAEALRESQLVLRKKYPHPKDWGAFICQGDPGPLTKIG